MLVLQATQDHLVAVVSNGGHGVEYRRAGQVSVGDIMLILSEGPQGNFLTRAQVVDKLTVRNKGLYAPLTPSGTIIVDGVVASVHR